MFQKLIQINEQRKELEIIVRKLKYDFEDSIALQKAQLDDLIDQENKLREEAFLQLEKENKTSEKVGDKTIIKQIKKTLKVVDAFKLRNDIIKNVKAEDYGLDTNKIIKSFDSKIIIKDKVTVNSIIDAYEKVEGKLLEGVEEQLTKFILIK